MVLIILWQSKTSFEGNLFTVISMAQEFSFFVIYFTSNLLFFNVVTKNTEQEPFKKRSRNHKLL